MSLTGGEGYSKVPQSICRHCYH